MTFVLLRRGVCKFACWTNQVFFLDERKAVDLQRSDLIAKPTYRGIRQLQSGLTDPAQGVFLCVLESFHISSQQLRPRGRVTSCT